MARAATLADAARAMTLLSDQLVRAVHAEDQDGIARVLAQARTLRAPHGFSEMDVLAVCLAVQVPAGVPLEQRVEWLNEPEAEREGRAA